LKIKKEKISTNIDKDNLEWLKSAGKGYQTRLNGVIRWARMNGCPIAQM
ncbi:MAG: BrnA antitoxin family protein, partial [Treponema sp.]|nr:BrnA antitoxin family protein [Treponema sp.]